MKKKIALLISTTVVFATACFAEDRYDYYGNRVSERSFSEQLERDQREHQEQQREMDRRRDELDRWYKDREQEQRMQDMERRQEQVERKMRSYRSDDE